MLRHDTSANIPAPSFNPTCLTPQRSLWHHRWSSNGRMIKLRAHQAVIMRYLHLSVNFNCVTMEKKKQLDCFMFLFSAMPHNTPLWLVRNSSVCQLVWLKMNWAKLVMFERGVFDLVAFHWFGRRWDFFTWRGALTDTASRQPSSKGQKWSLKTSCAYCF